MAKRKSQKKEKDTRSPEEIIGETARMVLEQLDGPESMARELCRLMEEGTPRQRIQAIEVGYSLSLCAEELQRQRERAAAPSPENEELESSPEEIGTGIGTDGRAQKNAPSPEKRKRRKLPTKIVRF